MIPVGKCRCMSCNAEFYAYEALYKIDLTPIQKQMNSLTQSNEDDNLGGLGDLEQINDSIGAIGDDIDIPDELFVSIKEIYDAPGRVLHKKGVKIRLLSDSSAKIDGNCCEQYVTTIGEYPIYRDVFFGCKCGSQREQAIEGRLTERYCPCCEEKGPLGESMGFRKNYLIMMFGNSTVGKTTWLKTVFDSVQKNEQIMGYTATNRQNKEQTWTANSIKTHEIGKIDDGKKPHTANNAMQADLCAYLSLCKGPEEIGFIFRDVAGENLKQTNQGREQASEARAFARFADGILVFRDAMLLPRVIERCTVAPEGFANLSHEEYQLSVKSKLEQLGVEVTEDLLEDKDVSETLMQLHIPDDSLPAIMYVLNKSDLLQSMINQPLANSAVGDSDSLIPLDYRCNTQEKQLTVLTSDSAMFKDVNHYSEFDMRTYLDCAIETNNFVAKEDSAFCGLFSQIVAQKKYRHGITCISSNPRNSKRVFEPLAWLIECLVNQSNIDFATSIAEQYAALDSSTK